MILFCLFILTFLIGFFLGKYKTLFNLLEEEEKEEKELNKIWREAYNIGFNQAVITRKK